MQKETIQDGRVRAWVLVSAQDPEMASALYEDLKDEGEDRYVVVRVDAVAPDERVAEAFDATMRVNANIVLPVDAESPEALMDVVDRIVGLGGVEVIAALTVSAHNPYPPHIANGYISEDEVNVYHDEVKRGREQGMDVEEEEIHPGRQHASPGFNPWG